MPKQQERETTITAREQGSHVSTATLPVSQPTAELLGNVEQPTQPSLLHQLPAKDWLYFVSRI